VALSLNRNDIIRDAAEDLGVIPVGQDVPYWFITKGHRKLNMILLSDQNIHKYLTQRTQRTVTTADGTTNYALNTACIIPDNVLLTVSGEDLPLSEMSWEEYQAVSNKTATGQPTSYAVDYSYDGAEIYLYPTPGTAYTVKYTSHEEFTELDDSDDVIPLRGKCYEYLSLRLAVALAPWQNREDKLPALMSLMGTAKSEMMQADTQVRMMRKRSGIPVT